MENKKIIALRLKVDKNFAIIKACEILKNSGVIIYPTDTIYGFGCDSRDDDAIDKLNKIKNRISPMSVLAPNISVAKKWMKLSLKDKINAQNIIGPKITIITPVKKISQQKNEYCLLASICFL